jgi:transcriptional regulator with XRE-family HTH domain
MLNLNYICATLKVAVMRIKEIIKERGLNIKEVASRLNVSNSSLSEAINGNPTVKMLNKIANVLDVDIREFFGRPDDELYGLVQYKGHTYRIESLESLKRLLSLVEANDISEKKSF